MGLRYTDFNALPVESIDYNQQVYVAEPQFASFGSLEVLVHNRGLYTVSTRRTTSAVNTLDSM